MQILLMKGFNGQCYTSLGGKIHSEECASLSEIQYALLQSMIEFLRMNLLQEDTSIVRKPESCVVLK